MHGDCHCVCSLEHPQLRHVCTAEAQVWFTGDDPVAGEIQAPFCRVCWELGLGTRTTDAR
jgi:hypothetical protein